MATWVSHPVQYVPVKKKINIQRIAIWRSICCVNPTSCLNVTYVPDIVLKGCVITRACRAWPRARNHATFQNYIWVLSYTSIHQWGGGVQRASFSKVEPRSRLLKHYLPAKLSSNQFDL